jgi:DNA polymerase-3 subunit gamma/tau
MDVPYTALARRFRPQTFAEVVGQERIAATLRNAILEGRVAHAYLFTGARGVGKTSMARIFAKALNCPHAADGVPCNACDICRAIAQGQDVDVSEIDGASNRGIDDIRALRANVHVRSMRSKYKIYIVDEVHMLTKEAFNALLKTLEEPPPSVKFIFCTTEPNKVPDTILSRCQRFDFGVIAARDIVTRLKQLADAEGFVVDQEALELVARRAAGSLRDSQSLFDQLLAFGTQHITAADVHRLLGTAPDDRLVALAQALLERDREAALTALNLALQEGVQLEPFTDQLVAYFRDLMVLAAGAVDLPLASVGEDCRPQLRAQAERWGLATVVAALEVLSETRLRMQRSTFGRTLTELALVRISLLRDLDRLDELIAQVRAGHAGGTTASLTHATLPASGGAPGKPSIPPPGSGAPPAQSSPRATPSVGGPATASSPASPQKKTVDLAAEAPVPTVTWGADCGPALLARLQERFNDITGTYLRQVVSTAISGPNQLELLFPAQYDFGRKACEHPEVVARLEAAVRELTGRHVQVRCRAIPDATPAVSTSSLMQPAVQSGRRQIVDDPADPLVREVAKVFGVATWQVQDLGRLDAPGPDEPQE